MRYLVLGDIHANLEALEAVLADASGQYERALFLGDLVDYGPNPNECFDLLRALPLDAELLGNHDLAALGKIDLRAFNPQAQRAAHWTESQLRADVREYLESLEPTAALDAAFLAHASPRDPVWEYLEEPGQAAANYGAFSGEIAMVGHTHVPRMFALHDGRLAVQVPAGDLEIQLVPGTRYILNPGGVGQPRDGDPRAAYVLWDTATGTITWRRVAYEVERTAEKILAAGLPAPLAQRLPLGL